MVGVVTDERTVMFVLPERRAVLACVGGRFAGRSFELGAGTFTIGRSPDCSLCLADDQGASRVHAKIFAEGDVYTLVDNESRNGTLVNGKPIRQKELRDGDELKVSGCILRFAVTGEPPLPNKPPLPYSRTTMERAATVNTASFTNAPSGMSAEGRMDPRPRPAHLPPEFDAADDDELSLPSFTPRSLPPMTAVTSLPQDPYPDAGFHPAAHVVSYPPGQTPVTMTRGRRRRARMSPTLLIAGISGAVIATGLVILVVAIVVARQRHKPATVVEPHNVVIAPAAPEAPVPNPTASDDAASDAASNTAPAAQATPDDSRDQDSRDDDKRTARRTKKSRRSSASAARSDADPPPTTDEEPADVDDADISWMAANADMGKPIRAPRTGGTVASVDVADGSTVTAGQAVVTLESGGSILSSATGKIVELKAKPGDTLRGNTMLARIVEPGPRRVRAVVPPTQGDRAMEGATVDLRRRGGGTGRGKVISVDKNTIVVDPGSTPADDVEAVRFR